MKGFLNRDAAYSSPYEFEGRIPLRMACRSGILPAALIALALNIILPKEPEDIAQES